MARTVDPEGGRRMLRYLLVLAMPLAGLAACGEQSGALESVVQGKPGSPAQPGQLPVPPQIPEEQFPGGGNTASLLPFPSLEKVSPLLPETMRPDFYAGRALARQPWVTAPTVTEARDGLGPVYNARACQACHIRGGKSPMPEDDSSRLFGPLVRLSLVGEDHRPDPRLGVTPEPTYGDQLQTQSIALHHQLNRSNPESIAASGKVAPEAYVHLIWREQLFEYPDGSQLQLRRPELNIRHKGYGAFHPDTHFSLRNAPGIHGMGLLSLIPQHAIDAWADPDDLNADGISGRVNQVWDARQQQLMPGRFGQKANRPTLEMIVASAFANDLGLSNPLFPGQPCTAKQQLCNEAQTGNNSQGFELPQEQLQLVVNFNRNLAVPARRNGHDPDVLAGRRAFYKTGCQRCHRPDYLTGDHKIFAHLSQQRIWPYTDLLLHDMGPALADGRPDFLASGSEWRTPPLWGIGLLEAVNGAANYLHDGRARSIEEAILWHGGEAEGIRQAFIRLPAKHRQQLIQFVESL